MGLHEFWLGVAILIPCGGALVAAGFLIGPATTIGTVSGWLGIATIGAGIYINK